MIPEMTRVDVRYNQISVLPIRCPVLLWGRQRDDEFQGVVQSDGRQPPHSMLPVTKHWEGVSVFVTGAEVSVAPVLRVA